MKDFKEYENKGLTGLANVGNTCYLNSFVQILSHTYELNQFLQKGEYKNKLNQKPDSVILLEFDKLFENFGIANVSLKHIGTASLLLADLRMNSKDSFTSHQKKSKSF